MSHRNVMEVNHIPLGKMYDGLNDGAVNKLYSTSALLADPVGIEGVSNINNATTASSELSSTFIPTTSADNLLKMNEVKFNISQIKEQMKFLQFQQEVSHG